MAGGTGSGKKRRRRKRKKEAGGAPASQPEAAAPAVTRPAEPAEPSSASADEPPRGDAGGGKKSARDVASELLAQEMMMYDEEDLTAFTPVALEEDGRIAAAAGRAGFDLGANNDETALEDIFDSREFLARKREKQAEDDERAGRPSSAVPTRKKIKRSDVEAYTKLLEMDPLADEDSSYFEEEGVDFISALLGDVEPGVGTESDENTNKSGKRVLKKTSFLGIGSGPLQVGHFFGALSAVLMAFVEYPGFPLTNLPDPLRGALQGGLATVYAINAVLAVLAFLSASERNQSPALWGAKTFAVGAIAYDQLMQIPTPGEAAEKRRREEEAARLRRGRRGRGKSS